MKRLTLIIVTTLTLGFAAPAGAGPHGVRAPCPPAGYDDVPKRCTYGTHPGWPGP